jgi:hypothetical protein
LKWRHLQNRVLCAIGNLDRCTPVLELHVALEITYVYDYIIILFRTQAVVILNHVNPNILVCDIGQEKPVIGSKRGDQAYCHSANCSFRVVKLGIACCTSMY